MMCVFIFLCILLLPLLQQFLFCYAIFNVSIELLYLFPLLSKVVMEHDRINIFFSSSFCIPQQSSFGNQSCSLESESIPDTNTCYVRDIDEVEHTPAVTEERSVTKVRFSQC